jgi:hypothetical protein
MLSPRYLLTLVLLVVIPLVGFVLVFTGLVIYSTVFLGRSLEQVTDVEQMAEATKLLLAGWLLAAFAGTLLWSEEKIHGRPPKRLLSLDGIVRLRRLGLAILIWLGLRVASTLVLYPLSRSAYGWAGLLQEWVALLPLAIAVFLLSAIAWLGFLAYCLRGLSLIFPRPLTLIGLLALGFGLLATLSAVSWSNAIYTFLVSAIYYLFLLFLILKDERIELAVGLLAADGLYNSSLFMSASQEEPLTLGLFTVDTDLLLNSPVLSTLSFCLFIARLGIFYYWFKGRSQRRQTFL